ncbi:heavy metal translocating P-type ATPase [Berryella wangjianweii]|uniref:Heavy metal translocating P-type ATPase n=1 Tax=Berryella wangjianweii TaxID=2734634 RepID=A0A6M8JAC6_9ACTN|nr:heavy metal translocating P-type ATPase [Berryella wangjianweii]QKF07772.1 heavy metal translocating P-type ATPase [Berryella wangjianweii]
MRFSVASEIPGRLRVKLAGPVPAEDMGPFEAALAACPDVVHARVYPRIGEVAVSFRATEGARARVLDHLGGIDAATIDRLRPEHAFSLARHSDQLLLDLVWIAGAYLLRRWFLPMPVSMALGLLAYRRFLVDALRSLGRARLDVPVLDAAAIGMSLVQLDPKTAGETMFLLGVGETLEEYTQVRSEGALVDALLDVAESAQKVEGDLELEVPVSSLQVGDVVAVRTGMGVSIDGEVMAGTAMVNQASLTGEPLAVERTVGDRVFAGTSVEDGEILVRVTSAPNETRLRSIVSLVKNADQYKSRRQASREALADRIVPWNFALAGGVALATRSMMRTSAALVVDYSCGLKLTSSISVLSAMSQSARAGFTVKGSKYFDAVREADTIVFDKTGTLTEATPRVAKVLAFGSWEVEEVIRLSACLEEHFPHPVARAVVNHARELGIDHRERHAEVEYIVAHGIASTLDGKRVVIGSEHFVIADEGVGIDGRQKGRITRQLKDHLSPLYLAVDGELVGVLGVEDPLKAGVREAIDELRLLGFTRVVMLTGDGERTAARIARESGVVEWRAGLLPEDKHAYVSQLKAEGRRVIMVGDGVNDAPALAVADVGIAMGQGTAVAKEVADITLTDGDLDSIVTLVRLSRALVRRMDAMFFRVMLLNSLFMLLGVVGAVTPQASSLLHNATTIALSYSASRPYRLPAR